MLWREAVLDASHRFSTGAARALRNVSTLFRRNWADSQAIASQGQAPSQTLDSLQRLCSVMKANVRRYNVSSTD